MLSKVGTEIETMRAYTRLTKSGIIFFAIMSALAGYAMGFEHYEPFDWVHMALFVFGLYLTCAGSFALNQAQEWRRDAKMPRTQSRPIPLGVISPWQAYALSALFLLVGLFLLFLISPQTSGLAGLTVILYNGVYTLFWKRFWAFGAVPGAIPGAMPVLIGYSATAPQLIQPESVYLFLIMFLWQMPHFWALAIRFREDYKKGGFPVLPTQLGIEKTLYHMGLYMFAYVGVALAAPWFLRTNILYLLLVVPLTVKVMLEFFKYFRARGQNGWLPFFLWVNVSMLVFLGVPVLDRWFFLLAR